MWRLSDQSPKFASFAAVSASASSLSSEYFRIVFNGYSRESWNDALSVSSSITNVAVASKLLADEEGGKVPSIVHDTSIRKFRVPVVESTLYFKAEGHFRRLGARFAQQITALGHFGC